MPVLNDTSVGSIPIVIGLLKVVTYRFSVSSFNRIVELHSLNRDSRFFSLIRSFSMINNE